MQWQWFLTCSVVDEKVLLALLLVDAEEVLRLLQDLAELDVLAEGELAGNSPFVGALRTVHDDLLRRGHVRRQQDGRVNLNERSAIRYLFHEE